MDINLFEEKKQATRNNNGKTSSWKHVLRGVLQGSVLGPLLYSLYVSDLSLQLEGCKHLFYADDRVIYVSCVIVEVSQCVMKLHEIIKNIGLF